MMEQRTSGAPCGSPNDFNQLLDRFELAWQSGPPPRLEDFLPPAANGADHSAPARRRVLEELVKMDLEYRWRQASREMSWLVGGRPNGQGGHGGSPGPIPDGLRLEHYVERFPELGPWERLPAELIREEYRVRRRWGDRPGPGEYAARFPHHRAALREMLAQVNAELSAERTTVGQTLSFPEAPPPAETFRCPRCHHPIELVGPPAEKIDCPSCGSAASVEAYRTAAREAGHPPFVRVGRYELGALLGTGAFGSVWRARDTKLAREVAVKLPRSGQFTSAIEEERFLREARAAARLRHPGIVAVHDVGREQGTVYLVSELVRGTSLAEWRKSRRPSFREAAELVAQVADALDYAHRQGVVHRDIKPSNIMLELDGAPAGPDAAALNGAVGTPPAPRPRVMDFGLAKRDAGEITLTLDAPLGTPAYMSPEQAHTPHTADGRSDVYSLGVILYQLLTGELPFRGVTRMVLHQLLHDEPRPPRRLNDKVPRDLETICLRCLQKAPGRRYETAGDLAADLRRWQAGEPILARPVGVWERAARWARRRPAVAVLSAVSAAAALGLLTLAGALWYNAEARAKALESLEAARAEMRDLNVRARRVRYVADIRMAQAAWEGNDVARVMTLLKRWLPDSEQEDLRGFEWHYLWRLCHSERLVLRGPGDAVASIAFSSDGKTLATGGGGRDRTLNWTVKLWDVTTGQVIATLTDDVGHITSLAFAPDGKTLAVGSYSGAVHIWDPATGRELITLQHSARHGVLAVAISPDGKTVASGGTDGAVKLWDLKTGELRATLEEHTDSIVSLAFAPDSGTLASGSHDQTVRLWNLSTKAVKVLRHQAPLTCVVFAPPDEREPERRVLASASDRAVTLWDVGTGQVLATLQGHVGLVKCVAFAPDGETLGTGSTDTTVRVWDRSGQRLFTLRGHRDKVNSVAFAPDGQTLATASADTTVRVWNATDPEKTVLGKHTGPVLSVTFTSDSRTMASAAQGWEGNKLVGEAKLWDGQTGKELATLDQHDGPFTCAALAANGQTLVSGGGDGTLTLWDVAGRKQRVAWKGHRAAVRSLALGPGGRGLASGSDDGTVKLWDVDSGKEQATLRGQHKVGVLSVALSLDGRRVLSGGGDGIVRLWDAESGEELRRFVGHTGRVQAVAFAPDGRTIASGGKDGIVRMWEADTGNELAVLRGHMADVRSVTFTPDGRALVSGGGDVKLWDVATGEERATLWGRSHRVCCVAPSPDGRRLAAGCLDGTVLLWEAATDQEIEAARK